MSEPLPSRGPRTEVPATNVDLESTLRTRCRADWPSVRDIDKDPLFLYQRHDGPHNTSKIEWWYVNGHFGLEGETQEQYSVFAAFFRLAIQTGSEAPLYAHAVNWALTDMHHKTYHTYSLLDPSTPELLSALIDSSEYHGDEFVLAALKEVFARGQVLQPDGMMTGATVSAPGDPLLLDFGGNVFRRADDETSQHSLPTYELILKGTNKVELHVHIRPRHPAALHGQGGVVSTGHWEEDMYYYFSPLCNALRGTFSPADPTGATPKKIIAGRFWIDHEFGGCVASNVEEAKYLRALTLEHTAGVEHSWEWAALQLNNETKDAISVTVLRNMNRGGMVVDMFAVHQCGATGKHTRYGRDVVKFQSVPGSSWKSPVTGMSFPQKWTVQVPHEGGMQLIITAAITNQEFVTLPGKPSYWEGRVTVEGEYSKDAHSAPSRVTGIGFMECHGERDLHAVSASYGLMHVLLCSPIEMNSNMAPLALEAPSTVGLVTLAVEQASMMIQMTTGETVPLTHKDLLKALLACYAVAYHHSDDQARVLAAMQWLKEQWAPVERTPFDFRTLVLRAFTLRTLHQLKQSKCTWLNDAKKAVDESAFAIPLAGSHGVTEETSSVVEDTVPTQAELETSASDAVIARLSEVASGRWVVDKSKKAGDISAFLASQGVGMMARMLIASVVPELVTTVDSCHRVIETDIVTAMSTTKSITRLDGTSWTWESFGRGTMTSRACARIVPQDLSCLIKVVTPLVAGDIELKSVWIRADGTLEEAMFLLDGKGERIVKATCRQFFCKKK